MNRIARAAFALAAVGCLNVAGCKKVDPGPFTPQEKLVSDLSMFVTGKPLAREDLPEAMQKPLDKYVDELLQHPMGRLGKDVAIGSTGAKDRHPVPGSMVLKSFTDDGDKIFYLRDKCEPSEAVKVKPWWDADKEVRVCPAAYRPTVMGDAKGNTCGAEMLAPRDIDVCGCGPALMFCTESREQYSRMQDVIQNEVVDTAAYVIDHDLPIEKMFTMNESVRGKEAEALYRRARALAGEDASKLFPVTDFEKRGKLAPRVEQVPGQMAGILSTPLETYSSDALRGVLRNYYDQMWCTGLQSSRVTTDAILHLDTVDLRVGDGWKKLAGMSICTDCHARLDYGMQFFHGYPNSTQGVDFRPSLVLPGKGPFYAKNIKDERGSDDLSPAGFARLATAQPEFGDCMTRRVVDHVFNGTETSDDYDAVHETFTSTHRLKAMLKTAMLRYAKREAKDRPSPKSGDSRSDDDSKTVAAHVVAPSAPGKIALSPKLQKLIKDDCKECHSKNDEMNFMQPELDRRELALMLDKVGFGAMPKDSQGLEDKERRAFVGELASLLYPEGADRAQADSYFGDGLRGDPVHRYSSAMASVGEVARTMPVDPNAPASVAASGDEDGDGDGDGDGEKSGGKGKSKSKSKSKSGSKSKSKADASPRSDVKIFRVQGIENAVPQSQMSYTPGMAVSSGIVALRTCKAAGLTGEALAGCVERASAPEYVIAGPLVP